MKNLTIHHYVTSALRSATLGAHKPRARFAVLLAAVALALVALAPSSPAALLLTEDFTGYSAGNLGGQGLWTQSGTGPVATVASATPLTYSGYNGGGGNYAVMPAPSSTTSKCYKGFTSTASAGNTFYVSFLLNLATATATSTNYFISLGDPTTGTSYGPRLFARGSGAGFVVGVSKAGNTANYGTTEYAFNTTHLIVLRYSGVTGSANDLAYVWVDPSLAAEPATGNADCSDTSLTDAAATLGNFIWHNRAINNASGAFDAVRLAAAATGAAAWADLAASSGATPPSVTTQTASSPSTSGATLNGTVIADGGASITDRGFYWSATTPVTTSNTQVSEGGTSIAAFSKPISGLSVNTIYYYRAYAVNSQGTGLSSTEVSFYTLANTPVAPTVNNPTAGTLDVAISGSDGNPSITTYAIKEAGGQYVQAGGALGALAVYQTASVWATTTVTGLVPSTPYSFTVQAENGGLVTTSFGPSAGLGTSAGTAIPVVTTQAASSLTSSGATLNGTVTANGGAPLTDRGFYWSAFTPVGTSDNPLSEGGTGVGAFSQALGGLNANTIYYYRAYGVNSVGTALDSSEVSFYTLAITPGAPTVDSPGSTTLNVTIASGDGNPVATVYAIQETTSGNYVQTDGTLGAAAVYHPAATWGAKIVTGLNYTTTYTFQVEAQNLAGTNTAFGPTASGTTAAAPVAAWDLTGLNTGPATATATLFNAKLASAPMIARGTGAAGSTANNSFRTTGFKNEGISTLSNDYFQVALAAAPGCTLSLSTLDARFAGTATFCVAPGVSAQFAYSLDGTTFTLIGSPFLLVGTPATMPQISLSSVSDLQSVPASTTVYLRYYASGQTATGGWGLYSPSAGSYGLAIGGNMTGSALASATITNIIGTTLTYGGGAGSQFVLVKSTNSAAPLIGWTRVHTNSATPGTFTVPAGSEAAAFYRIKSE
jgi:hypothetical protein